MQLEPIRTPAQADIAAIVAALRAAASETGKTTTIGALVALFGKHSPVLVILVLSVFNMLPGPPGYGGTVAITTFAFALVLVTGRAVRPPRFIARRRVKLKLVLQVLKRLSWLSGQSARLFKPRISWLTGAISEKPFGVFVMLICLPMMLPIPLINALPNVGICVMCLARLNRDGAGFVLGTALALCGLAIAALFVWGAATLGMGLATGETALPWQ